MKLTGYIDFTANWAQLDLDTGQTNHGLVLPVSVVLLKNPMAPGSTQAQQIAAAYNYFSGEDGEHYTLTGQLMPSGGIDYFLVTHAVQG